MRRQIATANGELFGYKIHGIYVSDNLMQLSFLASYDLV